MSSPWPRRATQAIRLGALGLGAGAPVRVQSMLTAPVTELPRAEAELGRIVLAGCEIVRVAVPDRDAAAALPAFVARSPLPVVADVHFDLDLGLRALAAGVHGLRVNPGTAGAQPDWAALARAAAAAGACLRVGGNAGSPSRAAREHPEGPVAGLVEAVVDTARRLAEAGAAHLKLSVKSARVAELVAANRHLAARADALRAPAPGWPLHLGLTEAGPPPGGEVKSAAALAILLAEGLGDTLRVSLSADPVWEVRAGHRLLRALGLSTRGADLVACPTCARCRGDVIGVATELRARLDAPGAPALDGVTLAVMGCPVNGPGEARAADVGAAAARDRWVLFCRGRVTGHAARGEVVDRLLALAADAGARPPGRDQ